MEQTIIRLAIGLVLLVAVNVVLGSLNALFDGTFDRIKCRNGVIKGIIIAACFVAFYVAGRLNPDIVAIDIDGETVNVATAANLAMVTAYVLYAKDVFSKLSKLVLSKTSGTPEQTGGTTPPALEEPADARRPPQQNKKGTPAPPWRRGSSAGHLLAGMARMTVFLLYSSVRTNTTPRRPSASGTVTASSVTAGETFACFSILISSR